MNNWLFVIINIMITIIMVSTNIINIVTIIVIDVITIIIILLLLLLAWCWRIGTRSCDNMWGQRWFWLQVPGGKNQWRDMGK